MKFFLSNKSKNKSSLVLVNKQIKFLILINLLKLHKNFLFNLFDFLYYNSRYKLSSLNSNKNNTNLIVLTKVIPFFIKGGNSFKNSIFFYNLFSKFYKIMYNNELGFKLTDYKYYKEFFYNFSRYSNYKNLNYLLHWIFFLIEPMFHIECSVVPKKYRKKLKKKYLYKIKYLNKHKRLNKTLNWISRYVNTLKNYSATNRQLLVFLDLLLNYKNSYIYNKKILIYKKVFKI